MPSFRQEIRTIQTLLAGSPWAADQPVAVVLDEYERFVGAGRLRDIERRTSLQVFFASRAIDSLLAYVVQWECTRLGGARRPPRHFALGPCCNFIQNNGIGANGNRFTAPTHTDIDNDLRQQRNRFMHTAGSFPTDAELTTFLNHTLQAIREVIAWRP